jgi:FlaA1/EpsC-like NDP-sugar epimerase
MENYKTATLTRLFLLVIIYTFTLIASSIISLEVRFDFNVPVQYFELLKKTEVWLIPIQLIVLSFFGQYHSLLTYFSYPDAKKIIYSQVLSFVIASIVWFFQAGEGVLPRGVLLTNLVLSITLLLALRMWMRRLREKVASIDLKVKKRTLIIGASSVGASLAREIQSKPGLGMNIVCFIDDDHKLRGKTIHGVPVLGRLCDLKEITMRLQIVRVILAMPKASPLIIRETISILNYLGLEHDILPSITEILHGDVTVSHLRHVEPEDLLGRDPVNLRDLDIKKLISDKTILITGAGGSIGSELCRQIASHSPKKIILLERSEPALFSIEQELVCDYKWISINPVAASVCNKERIDSIFRKERPQIVFHAAAHKHVPLMELQPDESILNNSLGTMIIAQAASRYSSQQMILVSTDKAVNPANVMGATKRLAELIVGAIQHEASNKTIFSSVRFGNVLGSSGSVIPTFRRQISLGGPVTVTHPEVTRFFMSIPEAVGLILQSAALAKGGEVFVLDMGSPIKIIDLARQMIELTGFSPDKDIEIEFTGLRPGEKLYEEPIHQAENIVKTSHPKIKSLIGITAREDILRSAEKIRTDLYSMTADELKQWLRDTIPEYSG